MALKPRPPPVISLVCATVESVLKRISDDPLPVRCKTVSADAADRAVSVSRVDVMVSLIDWGLMKVIPCASWESS